ncbi:hypothetical protein PPL_10484 [Heterostelium album PN500]|uniref:C2H2-type domain-containing protein n=1 Tax=Heterostelium pallidum (strain ATCC 26659 / Pp 5 / PN500) TaxID=670386 RepID=D3BR80_HETP5|nr:hypothetical protein PPL_10484 [Heterostelium album PN500]EFA75912.1 hypothetical protein PPL_10484 [Heterostelium album PN500]|eukprot:XP_020428046.1 hypothetical protein PPL_10484 [Heterostelium album PN500]
MECAINDRQRVTIYIYEKILNVFPEKPNILSFALLLFAFCRLHTLPSLSNTTPTLISGMKKWWFLTGSLIIKYNCDYQSGGSDDYNGLVVGDIVQQQTEYPHPPTYGMQQPMAPQTTFTNRISRDCSSELSNKVRAILDNIFYPVVVDHKYQLPVNCQLNPSLDMLAYLETQKINLYSIWKCRNCSKQFNTEEFLDLHLKNNHASLIPSNATVCLSDFCDMLNCKDDPVIACDNKRMDKLKHHCQSIMYNCFPLNQEQSRMLNSHFTKNICDHLTCDGYKRHIPKQSDSNQSNSGRSWSLMKYIAALITIIIIVLFYLIVCFYRKETILQKDLRRLSNKRHRDLLKQFDSKNH